jgi:glutamyl/glutaminyl-tRNA synthetase
VLTNFNVNSINVTPNFPYTGTWYNLMDNTPINVTSTTGPINIEAGGFRVYGNQLPNLSNNEFEPLSKVTLAPNPTSSYFTINSDVTKVEILFKSLLEQLQMKIGEVMPIFRILLTGIMQGPPVFDTINLLGAEESIARLKKQI